jgi:hypothetical protein
MELEKRVTSLEERAHQVPCNDDFDDNKAPQQSKPHGTIRKTPPGSQRERVRSALKNKYGMLGYVCPHSSLPNAS